ncbi:transposase [Rhodobacteraceae bacterium M385]|nr:transposase [Rhodobacteraceae bacterium M385]
MYPNLKLGYTNDQETQFSDKFKATVALEALRGDKTAQEIAAKHKIHPTQVTTWMRQAIDGLTGVFSDKVRKVEDNEAELKELPAKIGKLAVETDFRHKG